MAQRRGEGEEALRTATTRRRYQRRRQGGVTSGDDRRRGGKTTMSGKAPHRLFHLRWISSDTSKTKELTKWIASTKKVPHRDMDKSPGGGRRLAKVNKTGCDCNQESGGASVDRTVGRQISRDGLKLLSQWQSLTGPKAAALAVVETLLALAASTSRRGVADEMSRGAQQMLSAPHQETEAAVRHRGGTQQETAWEREKKKTEKHFDVQRSKAFTERISNTSKVVTKGGSRETAERQQRERERERERASEQQREQSIYRKKFKHEQSGSDEGGQQRDSREKGCDWQHQTKGYRTKPSAAPTRLHLPTTADLEQPDFNDSDDVANACDIRNPTPHAKGPPPPQQTRKETTTTLRPTSPPPPPPPLQVTARATCIAYLALRHWRRRRQMRVRAKHARTLEYRHVDPNLQGEEGGGAHMELDAVDGARKVGQQSATALAIPTTPAAATPALLKACPSSAWTAVPAALISGRWRRCVDCGKKRQGPHYDRGGRWGGGGKGADPGSGWLERRLQSDLKHSVSRIEAFLETEITASEESSTSKSEEEGSSGDGNQDN
ncbi:hypothetical protein DFJ73DRAFT_967428 [Zopfochytrium polystomum]|nr:hypothetical protein DFJ73DRAFT_967428 [Zopfochytrium polystomum]